PIQGNREYDVHLDVPIPEIPAWWTKKDLKRWDHLVAKRIDLVVHGQDAIWIMEITPKVSKASVGGCIAYRDLYIKQFQPEKPVKCGIIVEMD
ncbi:unnamed protein product, partial [marine sediment metagenome]